MINTDSVEQIQNQKPLIENNSSEPIKQQKSERLLSLDAYRGFTILGMIVADHLQQMEGAAWWLVHPTWHGITLADLVFPAFLFIMGVAIPLAVNHKKPINPKNIFRVFLLFALGLVLNVMADYPIVRILGILQRMSICYGIVLFFHWFSDYGKNHLKRLIGALFMIILVIIYIPLMANWQKPQIGCYKQNNLQNFCNFAGYIDRLVLSQKHIIPHTDPEGIISTLNAVFTTYMGYVFGMILVYYKSDMKMLIKSWLAIAFLCFLPIYPSSLLFPFNKKLYTTTFLFTVLTTSMTVLTLFMVLIDFAAAQKLSFAPKLRKAVSPLIWMGMNPLAIFIVLQLLFDIMKIWIKIDGNTPYQLFYDAYFSWMAPEIGTAVYGLFYAIFYFLVSWILYRRKLFLRL